MRKSNILSLLFLSVICLSSCNRLFGHKDPVYYYTVYDLAVSFQDASGGDLVKDIGLKEVQSGVPAGATKEEDIASDQYQLDIIVGIPCWNWSNDTYSTFSEPTTAPFDVKRPKLELYNHDNRYYLYNHFKLPVDDCPEENKLTYKLKCPHVFGDGEVHDWVTYWDVPAERLTTDARAKCLRIEFDGEEIIPEECVDEWGNTIYRVVVVVK